MSNNNKSIAELVMELQSENESLQSLKKLFNQAVKNEFGYDVRALHQLIEKQNLYEQRRLERQGQQTTVSQSEM